MPTTPCHTSRALNAQTSQLLNRRTRAALLHRLDERSALRCRRHRAINTKAQSATSTTIPQKSSNIMAPNGALQELLSGQQLGADKSAVQSSVQEYYTALKGSEDLLTSACTTCKAPSEQVRAYLKDVPKEIVDRYYGCGTPLPLGITGLRVLDLGCGTGRDCYVAARMVGEKGFVTGIDMTPDQLKVANQYVDQYTSNVLQYAQPNMRFVQGTIEKLDGIADESQDLVISNCVINLSPDKASVLQEVYRVLAPGGEMYFSDIYADRRLPMELRTHPVLLGECLGGALYTNDFIRLARQAGFTDPRVLESEDVRITDPALADLLGNTRFTSITYRLFKVPGRLEDLCEDYGQVAVYRGTLPGHRHSYALDDHHIFQTNKPMLVCGNTASMVEETWLGKHFVVTGDRSVHYGLFDCSSPAPASNSSAVCAPGGACC